MYSAVYNWSSVGEDRFHKVVVHGIIYDDGRGQVPTVIHVMQPIN